VKTNQEYFPDFGYEPPRRTKNECPNPAFKNHHLHRIGVFKTVHSGDVDDGLLGWFTELRCVNCGRSFGSGGFYPDEMTGVSINGKSKKH